MAASQTPVVGGGLFAAVSSAPAAQALLRRVEQGGALSCGGVAVAAQPLLAALLQNHFPGRPIVVVTDSLKTQESFHQDLETWAALSRGARGEGREPEGSASASGPRPSALAPRPLFFPAWEILPHEDKLPHADVISERLATLVALSSKSKVRHPRSEIIVASVTALLQRTFPPAELAARTRVLRRGDRVNPLDLVERLEDNGYESEAQVSAKGELAMRGGIVDVFPLTSPWPVRLEFFGDELESLRHFDPVTQVSREGGEISEVILPPAGEIGVLKRQIQNSKLITHNSEGFATLLGHLPRETIFVLCEPDSLAAHADDYAGQVPANDPFFITWEEFREEIGARGMTSVGVEEAGEEQIRAPLFSSLDAFRPLAERAPDPLVTEGQRREFFAQLHRWLRQDCAVHVFCNNDGERQRFEEIWAELGFNREPERALPPSPLAPRPSTHLGSLARGFICAEAKLVVVTDAEIFGRYKIQRPRRLKSPHAAAARSALDIDFTELEEGDYVVHVQHGIGRFRGLKILPTSSRAQGRAGSPLPAGSGAHEVTRPTETGTECLVIEYAPGAPANEPPKLYVPVTEAHLISKYVGAGKARPPLNTLGGKRWEKTKEQAERAVRDLAAELLAVQARRAAQPGHAFSADTPWQREFEGAFIYEETPDQIKAIAETKRDLEIPKPMDRLICGDVGFGKTEVAIRAAFKAVMGGRQVVVLVPTTVLAQQHFNTFRERMADYPVRVDLLSRFRSRREQAKVIADLAAGAVDIVIGTHRLVQDDVHFKELGLVVIDEEQRFGVLQKEKFKLLRTHVDVLTLSATPIPRTLYLALTGARDMSTIQTPPQDRLPVETVVTQYDERLIRDAIQRELNRGGQVFFLHNRVTTIDAVRARLAHLVPHARIVTGHGQMDGDDLERVMTAFVNGEADVLLSTTIIESGLDIPNANTIIIDHAERFGLSELYQLRGRVGRYKHQAHAYLLLPRHARLLTDVRKRMSAIKQYAQLGSGFKIAMRDLEIRGAGNLLGAQQSGHITAVGFELYCHLLQQSVATLKGEKVKPRVDVAVKLDFLPIGVEVDTVDLAEPTAEFTDSPRPSFSPHRMRGKDQGEESAHLPRHFITEPQQRIEIYRKLAQAEDRTALEALRVEVRDRFGPLPKPAELLWLATEVKQLCALRGITRLETQDDKLMLTRRDGYLTLGGKFPRLTRITAEARLKEIKKLLLAV